MELKTLSSLGDLENGFLIMKELRPHLNFDSFMTLYQAAKAADSYTIVGAFESEVCTAVMGYRTLHDYVHGKHLYIDDLVVSEKLRSKGVGKKLLDFAEKTAAETGCTLLRLSTGLENTRGKAFYEREGWTLRSVTYKKPVKNG